MVKNFRTFIESTDDVKPVYRKDNPGGDWLYYKQRDAEEGDFAYHKGIRGAMTGSYRNLKIPPSHLMELPGARGEEEYRKSGHRKFDRMAERVKENGWDEDPINAIYVAVNHLGKAYIGEGNHRTAVAHAVGRPWIHAEVRYFNGGERMPGPWSPEEVKKRYDPD